MNELKDESVEIVNVGALMDILVSFHYFCWPNANSPFFHTYFSIFDYVLENYELSIP